jgi:membrane protease YdiL (CAAX protease family)
MSILPNIAEIALQGAMLAWMLLAAAVAWKLVVKSENSAPGAPRLRDGEPAGILFYIMVVGAFVWLAVSIGYGQYLHAQAAAASSRPVTLEMRPNDLLFLSTVPPLLALCAFGLLDRLLMPRGLKTIGIDLGGFLRGIPGGAIGIFVALPLVFWVGQLMEIIYLLFNLHTPSVHELLKTIQTHPSDRRIGLVILAAVIVAPPFEEVLFRGHLQTLLRHLFRTWLPSIFSESGAAWTAICCASIIFALVHPLWMAPMIFVLALCLGYAYERTGNLWVCICMHALFNLMSIGQFLTLR